MEIEKIIVEKIYNFARAIMEKVLDMFAEIADQKMFYLKNFNVAFVGLLLEYKFTGTPEAV